MAEWLADDLESSLASVPGSPEREHVLTLLKRARRIRLGDDVARAAAETVRHASDTIERNLDRLILRGLSTWIEYRHAPRVAVFGPAETPPDDAKVPDTVGCLVACDPSHPSRVAVFVAWRLTNGAVHHSYALLHWDLATFLRLCSEAPARADGKAAERLLAASAASVPPGLEAELEIWQGHRAANDPRRYQAILQTQRDAVGEHLFLLAALLLVESRSVILDDVRPAAPEPTAAANDNPADPVEANGPTGDDIEEEPQPGNSWQAGLAAPVRRWPWQPGGFRAPMFGGPLLWSEPRRARRWHN